MFKLGKRQFEADLVFKVPSMAGAEEVSMGVQFNIIGDSAYAKAAGEGDSVVAALIVSKLFGIQDEGGKLLAEDGTDSHKVIGAVIDDPIALRAILNKYVAVVYADEVDSVRAEQVKN